MLETEAFALLTKKVWHMLTSNTKFSGELVRVVKNLKPKHFRENVARMVLQALAKELGLAVSPLALESGEDFIDTIALWFALLAEEDRPPKHDGFTPNAFAETLIIKFCCGYALLADAAPTDEVLQKCRVTLSISTCTDEVLSLRQRIQAMPPAEFGQYSLQNQIPNLYQPESK